MKMRCRSAVVMTVFMNGCFAIWDRMKTENSMITINRKDVYKVCRVILCLVIFGLLFWRYTTRVPQRQRPVIRTQGLRADSAQFTLEGEPFRILGGSVHYFRVPRAYWRDRMLKMKACGLNTLTTYVPWNLHEPEKGVFNFYGQLELEAYIREAAQVGLWVILRPGPYICSEWDLGGLPSWLLRDNSMKLRTTHPGFTEAVSTFFNELIPRVAPLQYMNGGPIIAFQVENEYGSYGDDARYMYFIKEALVSRGVSELLLTSDNQKGLEKGALNGVLKSINFQKIHPEAVQRLEASQPGRPKLVMEFWSGWFDAWGSLHHIFDTEEMIKMVTEILKRGMSINFYMFHGGTNFGFMNGALGNHPYKPLVTSYDYDAPLSEAGDYTQKYYRLRTLLSAYHREGLPRMPSVRWKKAYKEAAVAQYLSLWDTLHHLEKPYQSESPVNMENLPVNNGNGQSYGYTLYETSVTRGGTLNSRNSVRDRALVFINRRFIGILDYKNVELTIPDGEGVRNLSLLVENCGRVNYGKDLNDQRKGLVGDILLNSIPLKGFRIYSLDMKPDFIQRLTTERWSHLPKAPSFPGFFYARFIVSGYVADTFVKGWNKGVVFVNGQNLGRYWSVGPQQTLYLPGPWLKNGANQIIVFEEQEADMKISFSDTPDLGMATDV